MWPEILSKMTKAAQRKEKQEWVVAKPKLDNARSFRGIYFIDPEDAEVRETMKKRADKAGSPNGNSYALHDQKWPVQGNLR